MNHGKNLRKLNRDIKDKRALLRNMAVSLIEYGKIETTIAKAKEIRRYVEKLITKAKVSSFHNERLISKYITNKKTMEKLFFEVAPKYKEVNGGYTRITRSRKRVGDNAQLAVIELIEDHK
jgi:large subunit ribosomal protein L17